MGSYLRTIRFLTMAKKEFIGKVFLGLAISLTYVTQAFAIAKGVAAVFNHDSIQKIAIFLMIAIFCILIRGYLIRVNEWYTRVIAAKIKDSIRSMLLEKLMLMGPGYQSKCRSGNLNSLITDGVEASEQFLVNYIPQVIITFCTVVPIVIYIWTLDWVVALIVFFSVALAVIGPHFSLPMVRNSIIEYWKSYAVLNAQYIDTMQGINTLKVFNASKNKGDELGENANKFARDSTKNTGVSLMDSSIIILFMTIASSLSIAIASWHTATGVLLVPSLFVILFLVPESVRPITDLNNFWHSSYLGFSVAEQLYDIIDAPIVITEKENPYKVENRTLRPPVVEFKDVTFSYDTKNENALQNVSLTINSGQSLAVVGQSGSGKSTMASLLLRFYDVSQGKILIDGIDIRDYDLEYLRSQIAIVFQDTYLFYGTVAENIKMGNQNVSDEQLYQAAKTANIHDFIMDLPDGYNTIVGERGATLSGGERQRIAIARAVLKDAPLLILDEATSSVDATNEAYIQEALFKLMENRTSIIIAHRLSTIRDAKKIIVLEEGNLVEEGTHELLLDRDRKYAKLIKAQQEGEEGNNV